MAGFNITVAGDSAINLEFGNVISEKTNGLIRAAAQTLEADPINGVIEFVPTFCSLMVVYDPCVVGYDELTSQVRGKLRGLVATTGGIHRVVKIPVCYGGDFGPDLGDVAEHAGMSAEEVIAIHSGHDYLIDMLGFLPGFAYLGGLDERLHTPRLATPRTRIEPGAVGIGGAPLRPRPRVAHPVRRRRLPALRSHHAAGVQPDRNSGGIRNLRMRDRQGKSDDPRPGWHRQRAERRLRSFRAQCERARRRPAGRCRPASQSKRGRRGRAMGVTVNKPGICTTVQDLGRRGYLGSGFSPSGVMDKRAARIANLLVDNGENAPVLEFCLAGPTLRFTTNTCIALTGGNFSPTVDGAAIPMYAAIMVHRGSVLEFGAPKTGVYGYLAIAGGSIAVPKVMGSASTNLKCGIGGWEGRALSAGDYLPFVTKNVDFLDNLGSHALKDDSFYGFSSDEIVLRVVPGPQEGMFTEQGVNTFFKETYTTTAKCDRMGFRLDGPEIETVNGSDIISDGIALGAVQIPNHGRPIIMLADRQTTGGYAKIGTVASVDIPKLVQCKPGRAIRFEEISVQEAQAACRKEAQEMRSLAKVVKRPCYGGVSPRRTARRLTPILEAQAKKSAGNKLWIEFEDGHNAAHAGDRA